MNNIYSTHRRSATCGNQKLVAPGLKAYLGSDRWNVKGGQLILWDKDTELTIAPADIPNVKRWGFAVGIGKAGSRAKCIQFLGFEDFDPCTDKFKVDYDHARCEVSQEVAAAIGCVRCDRVYDLDIYVTDPYLRMQTGHAESVISVDATTRCSAPCDECPPTKASCFEVICGFYNKLREKVGKVTWGQVTFDNSDKGYLPFWPAVLDLNLSKVFKACISVKEEDCAKCARLGLLESITITPFVLDDAGEIIDGDPVTLDLAEQGLASGDCTEKEDLDAIEECLNEFLKPYKGGGVITGGNGCCAAEIKLAGCFKVTEIIVDGDPVELCEQEIDMAIEQESICKACPTVDKEPYSPNCALYFFMKSQRQICNCNVPADAVNYENLRAAITDIQFSSPDYEDNFYAWKPIQEWCSPIGAGYEIINAMLGDRNNEQGGEGGFRFYGGMGEVHGKFNSTPRFHEYFEEITNHKCDEHYCPVSILQEREWKQEHGANSQTHCNTASFMLDIPIQDTDTIDDFVAVIDEIVKLGACNCHGHPCGKECGQEQDPVAFGACGGCVEPEEEEAEVDNPKAKASEEGK